jgi:hypothetical protein
MKQLQEIFLGFLFLSFKTINEHLAFIKLFNIKPSVEK